MKRRIQGLIDRFPCLIIALQLTMLLTGCLGYTVGPVQPTFMKGVHKIAVPVLRNDTLAPDVETLATTTIIKQLQQDGTYQITGEDQADAIVRGDITNVQRTKARALRGNTLASSEFNLLVTIRFRVVRPNTEALLGQRDISGVSSFFVGEDVATQERQAIPLAVEDAAVQLASYLSEGF